MAKTRAHQVDALDRSPSHLLHRAVQLALDIYGEELGPATVTQRQYAVLCAVSADEGLSQTGLVRATGIDRSTLAELVGRMISKGLLIRERSASDARANTVHLSEEGRAALAATRPQVAEADRRLLGLLGSKKRDPFVAALRRLAKAGEATLLPVASEASTEREPGPERNDAKRLKTKKGGKAKTRRKKTATKSSEPSETSIP